jgi:hypothetical protein
MTLWLRIYGHRLNKIVYIYIFFCHINNLYLCSHVHLKEYDIIELTVQKIERMNIIYARC